MVVGVIGTRGMNVLGSAVYQKMTSLIVALLCWEGVSYHRHTSLYELDNGTVNARHYDDEILRPHAILYAVAIGQEFTMDATMLQLNMQELSISTFTTKMLNV